MLKKMIVFVLFVGIMGCASTKTSNTSGQNIPPNSKFSKISVGMSQKQVWDLIGTPTDMKSFPTPKSFNPLYFGSDTVHSLYLYKGEGSVEVDHDAMVVEITYDPSESGYIKK